MHYLLNQISKWTCEGIFFNLWSPQKFYICTQVIAPGKLKFPTFFSDVYTSICKRCNSLLGNTAWTTVTIATMYTCLPYTYTVYFEHNVAQMGQWIHMYSPTCHMMQWDRTDIGISWVGAQVRQWIPMDRHMGQWDNKMDSGIWSPQVITVRVCNSHEVSTPPSG